MEVWSSPFRFHSTISPYTNVPERIRAIIANNAPPARERNRAIIADDEPPAGERIRDVLKREPYIDVVAECTDGISAVEAVERLEPDLLFLDEHMPELDRFDVIERTATH